MLKDKEEMSTNFNGKGFEPKIPRSAKVSFKDKKTIKVFS